MKNSIPWTSPKASMGPVCGAFSGEEVSISSFSVDPGPDPDLALSAYSVIFLEPWMVRKSHDRTRWSRQ